MPEKPNLTVFIVCLISILTLIAGAGLVVYAAVEIVRAL